MTVVSAQVSLQVSNATSLFASAQITGQSAVTNSLPANSPIMSGFEFGASARMSQFYGGDVTTDIYWSTAGNEIEFTLNDGAVTNMPTTGAAAGSVASAIAANREYLITLVSATTLDANLAIEWEGSVDGSGSALIQVDAFDDGVVDLSSGGGTTASNTVTVSQSSAAFTIRVRSAVSANGTGYSLGTSTLRLRLAPKTSVSVDFSGCVFPGVIASATPQLDGGVNLGLYVSQSYRSLAGASFLVLGAPLTAPLALPSSVATISCTLAVDPTIVVPVSLSPVFTRIDIPGNIPSVLRPFSIDAQFVLFETNLQWVATSGAISMTFTP